MFDLTSGWKTRSNTPGGAGVKERKRVSPQPSPLTTKKFPVAGPLSLLLNSMLRFWGGVSRRFFVMSEARELFAECSRSGLVPPANELTFQKLNRSAEIWRAAGQHFSAAMAMSIAVNAAWGQPSQMAEAQRAALRDFANAVSKSTKGFPEWIASIHMLMVELGRMEWLFEAERGSLKIKRQELGIELGACLLSNYADAGDADNYLVRGIRLITDLDGSWKVETPLHEVPLGSMSYGEIVTLNIPSAFHIFVQNADWPSANKIIEARPNAFTSPGLKGW